MTTIITPGTLLTPKQVADRRALASHTSPSVSMFARMLLRAAVLRRRRAASALLAMIVAAAVATAMMNLYVDVQAKLRSEFRNYGANVVVVAKDGQSLPANALTRIESVLGAKTLAVPFSYAVARIKGGQSDGQSVVVVGTDFARSRQLNHWWKVSHWPDAPNEALIGMRAAAVVIPKASSNRQPFELTFQGKPIQLAPAGLLQTGAGEDSRIYIDQSEFQSWTGVAPSTIEVAANGTAADVDASIRQLAQLLPTAEVRPVRQIMEGEANVLNKTRATLYASATLVVLTSALCVLATLIGWVFDRRRDFAIMKALGASERLVNGFFAAEAAALGVVGAILGFFIGIGVAALIGRVNFHAPVVPRFSVFPYVLAGSVAVALISAILPIVLLRRVQPAIILRGE
ncbi:MAG TPA: ABC transporter permease [Terriglobales bacterium]|jgi:putative ABC transport system permease protein|nr:ABC transporter permease [Terriglobales bacterium]